MNHPDRVWCVQEVKSPMELARKLTQGRWELCAGFDLKYLFLNDSAPGDGSQEFVILKPLGEGRFVQVESIPVGWFTYDVALGFIQAALAGEMDPFSLGEVLRLHLDTPLTHGVCPHCRATAALPVTR